MGKVIYLPAGVMPNAPLDSNKSDVPSIVDEVVTTMIYDGIEVGL